jgi:cytochrome c-type biogenesis protein CcmH/NrfF
MSTAPRVHRGAKSRSRVRLLIPVLVMLALCGVSAGTAAAANTKQVKDTHNYYESILPQFMCVACHEPLELVSSPEAISEQQTLRGFVNQGMTLSQIKSAMVAQYSVQVLAKPPASGFNLTVYVLPPVVVIAGLLLLAYTLPKWRRRSRLAAATELPSSDPLKPEEASRLDSELDQFI